MKVERRQMENMIDKTENNNIKNKSYHYSDKFPEVNEQTWDKFYEAVKDKGVVLFGTGVIANRYYIDYKQYLVEIIDNDPRKWGVPVKNLIATAVDDEVGNICIKEPKRISEMNKDELVFLIANVKYYEDIIEQLEELGVKDYYVLKILEVNEKIRGGNTGKSSEKIKEWAERYSKEPIRANKVFFYDHMGTFSGHGKYITKRLLEMRPDIDIVWAVNDLTVAVPSGVRLVYVKDWERYLAEAETAKVWVFDHLVPRSLIKRQEQIYINVKHWASITLKKFGMDLDKFRNGPFGQLYVNNGKKLDYILIGSEFDEESCRNGYAWNGKFVKVGSPRSDILFRGNEIREEVCKECGLSADKKYLLYAPTYRHRDDSIHNESISRIDLDFEMIKKTLDMVTGEEWYILLRLHPSVIVESYKVNKPDWVIDVSAYHDAQELVVASDILVTDYSSIMFEAAFVAKPVFLLATDLAEYLERERDFLIDYYTLPFDIAETNVVLSEKIKAFNYEEYKGSVKDFLKAYGIKEDGFASNRAAEFICGLIDNINC